jgi:hypothetical protein
MPITFATSFGQLGVILLLGVTASAQNTPEEVQKPLFKEIERQFPTMVTTTPPAPVGLINAGPAIGTSAQKLFALTSGLPVSQPRSNV